MIFSNYMVGQVGPKLIMNPIVAQVDRVLYNCESRRNSLLAAHH